MINKIVLTLFLSIFSSCIYFNTFYNAKESFKQAQHIIDIKDYREIELPAQAKTLLDESIINSRVILEKYPDSKYVEEAYYIIAVSMFLKEDYIGSKENLKILDY